MRRPDSNLWLGHGAHVVHYPLRSGKMINVVAVVDAREMLDEKADLWYQRASNLDRGAVGALGAAHSRSRRKSRGVARLAADRT